MLGGSRVPGQLLQGVRKSFLSLTLLNTANSHTPLSSDSRRSATSLPRAPWYRSLQANIIRAESTDFRNLQFSGHLLDNVLWWCCTAEAAPESHLTQPERSRNPAQTYEETRCSVRTTRGITN